MKIIAIIFVLGFIVSVSDAGVPVDKLVLYFPFEEGKGDLVRDLSEEGNDGEIEGGAEWSKDGRYGNALEFNATDSYVLVPNSPSLEIDTEVTIMAWIKWIDAGDAWLGIMANGKQNGPWENYGMFVNRSGKYLYFVVNADNDAVAHSSANGTTEPEVWQHVCGTYDGDTAKIHADGELIFEQQRGQPLTPPGLDLRIGHRLDSTHFFNGLIDEVAIFEEALDEAEIKEAMAGLAELLSVEPIGKVPVTWGIVKEQ